MGVCMPARLGSIWGLHAGLQQHGQLQQPQVQAGSMSKSLVRAVQQLRVLAVKINI